MWGPGVDSDLRALTDPGKNSKSRELSVTCFHRHPSSIINGWAFLDAGVFKANREASSVIPSCCWPSISSDGWHRHKGLLMHTGSFHTRANTSGGAAISAGANINAWCQTCAEHASIALHQLSGRSERGLFLELLSPALALPWFDMDWTCSAYNMATEVFLLRRMKDSSTLPPVAGKILKLPKNNFTYLKRCNLTHKTEIMSWQSDSDYLPNCMCIVTNLLTPIYATGINSWAE